MTDDIARYNEARWDELARAGVPFSRPYLDLTPQSALESVDPMGMIGQIEGKVVGHHLASLCLLCLAGGGGQQSAAFALLGANVTVFDLSGARPRRRRSETQLQRDRDTAKHYGTDITTVHGDMRDLSAFGDDSFDVVYNAHSLTFVPDSRPVLNEVSRVLRHDGLFRTHYNNPFVHGAYDHWNGDGYVLKDPYVDGEVVPKDVHWDVKTDEGETRRVVGPREFRHKLSTVVNGLVERGFVILGL